MIIGIRALPFSAIAIFTGVAAMSAGANANKAKVMIKDGQVFIFCFLPLISLLEIHTWFDA